MDKKYHIELFDKNLHESFGFTCGIKELDIYLKEHAGQETRKKVTAVYVIHENGSKKIIGYYTLSSYSIELTDLPADVSKKLPKYPLLPVTLIGRLAVDKHEQGKRIGEYLLLDALVRSYRLSKEIGSAVVVEAKNEMAKHFYEKYGFRTTLKHPFKLYILMRTIKQFIRV